MSNNQIDKHIAEETLHAWLDSELGRRESGFLQQHVQSCTECAELLNECRELRGTISQLLGSFDAELATAPRTTRSRRPKLVLSGAIPSAPIISHIVADSQPVKFRASAQKFGSIAAVALIFAGTASLALVRGYHVVAGSVNTVANTRPFGGVYSNRNSVTVTGAVTGIGGIPVRSAVVTVLDSNAHATTLQAVADRDGRFRIRGVPRSATALEVHARMGYLSRRETVNLSTAVNPEVNVVLLAEVRKLEPVVVTTAQPTFTAPARQSCLDAFEPFSASDQRMFQSLRGQIKSSGDFRMDIVDWPTTGSKVSAVFTLESANTLVGRVRAKSAELRITLTRDGDVWRGSASETRDYKPRWRRVALRESSCAI